MDDEFDRRKRITLSDSPYLQTRVRSFVILPSLYWGEAVRHSVMRLAGRSIPGMNPGDLIPNLSAARAAPAGARAKLHDLLHAPGGDFAGHLVVHYEDGGAFGASTTVVLTQARM